MKKIILLACLCLFFDIVPAQYLNRFDLYNVDLKIINPAFTASSEGQSFTGFFKSRYYNNADNLPRQFLLGYDVNIPGGNFGVGLLLANDDMIIQQKSFELLGSYVINFQDNRFLRLGASFVSFKNQNRDSFFLLRRPLEANTNFGVAYTSNQWTVATSFRTILGKRVPGLDGQRASNITWNGYVSRKFEFSKILKLEPVLLLEADKHDYRTDLALRMKFFDLILFGPRVRINSYLTETFCYLGVDYREMMQLFFQAKVLNGYEASYSYAETFELGARVFLK